MTHLELAMANRAHVAETPRKVGARLDTGSSGPGWARRRDLALAAALKGARNGESIGRSISAALTLHGVSTRDLGHLAEVVGAMTLEIRAMMRIPEPEVRQDRAYRGPRISPSDRQTDLEKMLRDLARAAGHPVDQITRILNRESPAV